LKKIELLAPASSFYSAKLAINAGANAIYLGYKKFNARLTTTNLTLEEIVDIVRYAHIRCVRVFITINTVIFEYELPEVIQLVDELIAVDVDAFIIQDLGLLNYLNQVYPTMEVHASTQMNVKNLNEASVLCNHGVKRIILARETPLEEIKRIKDSLDIELEVFVHGALCSSYSGQCLISSRLEGRSGNRGVCAQVCRYKFDKYINNKRVDSAYYLSTKDLCTIEHLSKLVGLVSSIKIEGRHRSDEYIYEVVSSYRKALDAIENNTSVNLLELKNNTSKVFNRMFTKGYLFSEKKEDINYTVAPNNQGFEIGKVIDYSSGYATISLSGDLRLGDGIRVLSRIEYGKNVDEIIVNKQSVTNANSGVTVRIPLKSPCYSGDKVIKTSSKDDSLKIIQFLRVEAKLVALECSVYIDGNNLYVKLSDDHSSAIGSIAIDTSLEALTKDDVLNSLSRLGSTPYFFRSLNIELDKAYVTQSQINHLRRDLISQLEESRLIRVKHIKHTFSYQTSNQVTKTNVCVKVWNQDALDYLSTRNDIDIIYYHHNLVPTKTDITTIPFFDRFSSSPDGALASSLSGGFHHLDYYLNVTNSYAIDFVNRYLGSPLYLSTELTTSYLEPLSPLIIKNKYNVGYVAYQKDELMIIASKLDIDVKKNEYITLKDQKIITKTDSNGNTTLYLDKPNNYTLFSRKIVSQYSSLGISNIRFDFIDESIEEIKSALKVLK
jgi:putative protease